MPEPVQPAIREHLGKLLGMLGSQFDGERSNAAAAATKLLKQHGWTWAEIAVHLPPAPQLRTDRMTKGRAQAILASGVELSQREHAFVEAMLRWTRPLSNKQEIWLEALETRDERPA